MKKTFTYFSKTFCFLLFLSLTTNLLAQPANDRCENATVITVEADEASIVYVDGDTRGAEDATLINDDYPNVCSGSWYTDDVWFSFTTGETLPTHGIIVQTEVGSVDSTDLANHGMGLYASCGTGSDPIDCFSDAPGRRTMALTSACLTANTTYIVRIWSAGNTTDVEGTFRIGAYEAESPLYVTDDVSLWIEDFEGGMGDWTTTGINDSTEYWRYYAPGEAVPNAFGGSDDLTTLRSACSAKMGYPGGWYQTGQTGDVGNVPAEPINYTDYRSDLISPTIDLSGATVPLTLKFDQTARKLSQNNPSNPHMYVSFSYDDGATWGDTTEINSEIAANDNPRQSSERVRLDDAAIGNSAVRVKFTYDMDFYFWIVDNIEIIEREASNLQLNRNWYAVAPNALTPKTQVVPMRFMVDVENIGAAAQTGTSLGMSIANSGGDVVHVDNLDYGTVDAGALVENQIMTTAYTPDAVADSYIGTYSIGSDSTDFDESNNEISFRFDVTENTFAREFGEGLGGITPNDPDIVNWSYGAYYYVPNGTGYEVTDVLFNIQNADDVVDGTVTVTLYRWEDQNGDGDAQPNERGVSTATPPITGAIVGTGSHTIAAGEEDIVVLLENWDDDELPVSLQDTSHYLVVCAFNSPAGSTEQIAIGSSSGDNSNTDYAPMNFVYNSLDNRPTFYNGFFNAFFGGDATFDTDLGFSWAWAPRIQMNIAETILDATEDNLDEANKIQIFPNPASDIVSLKLELANVFEEGIVKISDVSGKTLSVNNYSNIQNELFTYDVSKYAAGTYFIQFVSEEGSRTERITIVR